MADLDYLKPVRGHHRAQVTKKCSYITDNIASLTQIQRHEYISSLRSLEAKLNDFDAQIGALVWKQKKEDLDGELASCDAYGEKISKVIALLENPQAQVPPNLDLINVNTKLKLPDLPLPEYSHAKGESIEKFFKDFEDVTNRASLNTYTKLLYLQKQTHKDPHILIQSLGSGSRTYEDAKDLLMKAFGSELFQKYESIKMLIDLRLSYQSDPYRFIGDMRVIKDSFNNLKITVEDILQYFFWNSVNDTFKAHMVQITGKSKPSLDEIEANIFETTNRYIETQRKYKEKKNTREMDSSVSSLAANVNVKQPQSSTAGNFKPCNLCTKDNASSANHPIYKCPAFDSPQSKIEKLNSMNACQKCASSHKTSDCKFRFNQKCRHCSKWHFSFLCNANKNYPKADSTAASKTETHSKSESSTSLIYLDFETLHLSIVSGSILPTFTTTLPDTSVMRCLKDSGSQMTFIETRLADQQGFEIVNPDFSLIVNGFNESKELKTKVVRLEIGPEGNHHTIEAVCVPRIKTTLSLPNLGTVVSEFVSKGYVLADKCLKSNDEKISGFGLLLGTDYDYCLPINTKMFGNSIPSIYLESPFGVMLSGNLDRMLKNLSELPDLNPVCASTFQTHLLEVGHEMSDFENSEDAATNMNLTVCDGELTESDLHKAVEDTLLQESQRVLNYDQTHYNDTSCELHEKMVDFVLNSSSRTEDGRMIMPLLWNKDVSHLLGKNQHLSKSILNATLKKYKDKGHQLTMMDDVFKEQQKGGIIEKVENLPQFLEEHPSYSFLPHMPVFRMSRESSKCRIVFLSNLCEKDSQKPMTVSHNQAMLAGPCLNRKISTAILQLRFDSKLLCFDLRKAFLMIELPESDQVKLLFYWFRNVAKQDFSVVAYKHCRLPFGLKPSPAILLLCLYKMLILDTQNDSQELINLKRRIYDLCYMDNCAYSTNDSSTLKGAYDKLRGIFEPYKFSLQQFVTNDQTLQDKIDKEQEEVTTTQVSLFGLIWDRHTDTLATQELRLDKTASTKRLVLQSIASNYDILNFNNPLLNRARLFMQQLQCMKNLDWDTNLPEDKQREWKNIAVQLNSFSQVKIKRFVGEKSDSYKLIAFTDSSKVIYASVLFIKNMRTQEISFLLSKSRLINKQLSAKSIPSLEFQAITLGTEVLVDIHNELSGQSCVEPIDIVGLELYTDSLVCLNWLNSHVNKIDKMKNINPFVFNRLIKVCRLCEACPITFRFCEGAFNPADCATRPCSYTQLVKSTFLSGPSFLSENNSGTDEMFQVIIPNPLVKISVVDRPVASRYVASNWSDNCETIDYLFPMDIFSEYHSIVSVQCKVLRFVNNCKLKLKLRDPSKYSHLRCFNFVEIYRKANMFLILQDQKVCFPEVFKYYSSKSPKVGDMPNVIGQLNIFPDESGVLRVKSKCARWKDRNKFSYSPILLSKSSLLTKSIILDLHRRTAHAGVYNLLSELRKQFYIPHYFSTVKKILKECVNCRRFHRQPIKLNQSDYRDFRLEPPNIPYRYVFIDHIGPFWTTWNGTKTKVWLLCVTCLWSRAVNLKICLDLTMPTFLRAFQMHVHEFGIPEKCFSDKGSQIVGGTNLVKDFLNDPDTKKYLEENSIGALEFNQYYKGCNKLGSLVESCVKLVKRLIHGSVKNSVLKYLDFEFLISEVIHLVNRRPVAFKDALRDNDLNEAIPAPITPEILLKGYELVSLNIIPNLQPIPDNDPSWTLGPTEHVRDSYAKLRKARTTLKEIYNSEFLAQLIGQATDRKSRYKPVVHQTLKVGDIVLIKEKFQKPANYPMGKILKVKINDFQEVTGATILKGNRATVELHAECLIPLLSVDEYYSDNIVDQSKSGEDRNEIDKRPKRLAAIQASDRIRMMARKDLP